MSWEELSPSQDLKQPGYGSVQLSAPAAKGERGAGGSNVATVLPLPRTKLSFI